MALLCGLVVAAAACSDDDTTRPGGGTCGPALPSPRQGNMPGLSLSASLGVADAATIRASTLAGCLTLPADSGTYLVVPQFATDRGPSTSTSYEVGAETPGASPSVMPVVAAARTGRALSLQHRFDWALRRAEHRIAPGAPAALERWRAATRLVKPHAATVPAQGSSRTFHVLATLEGDVQDPSSYQDDTATLRYVGTNILIYVSDDAPSGGFTDAQLAAFGRVFDQDLFGIDVRTFGEPSDIDGNGKVIVLLSPIVNQLTNAGDCQTLGFVSGFFFGGDLLPGFTGSNSGEIFYAIVPDPNGTFSCTHSLESVERTTPVTFIHEFQHMISWNQHVIIRQGQDEVTWLNEGLSHIAEEMGARYYEHKFPPPAGRTNPNQIFPDSAEAFITGDLINSYGYLQNSADWSITKFIEGGTTQERGGAWLFLRWLGDQKDSTIYKKLVQTNLRGVANVVAQAGEDFPKLFGDFSLAVYTDSLPGLPRDVVSGRYRFRSRNLRFLYDALFRAVDDSTILPRPFPIAVNSIAAPGTGSSSMVPGTMEFFRIQMPKSGASDVLRFSAPGGAALSDSLSAQVTIFRCPSAAACP